MNLNYNLEIVKENSLFHRDWCAFISIGLFKQLRYSIFNLN